MKKYTILDFYQLQRDIDSKPLKPIYLMFGEESYLHNMVFDDFKRNLQKDQSIVNYEIFYGENIDLNLLANSIRILPLGAGKQCIIIKQLDKLKISFAKKLDLLLNSLSFQNKNLIILLFSLNKKLPTNLSLDKIKKIGVLVSLQKLKSFQMKQWIQLKCLENHREISPEAMYYLQSLTDNDLGQMNNEIEKILCYLDEGSSKINGEDVIGNLYGLNSGNIFDFVDAIGERKTQLTLCLLKKLEENEYHALSLLAMISRQIKLILQIKRLEGDQENLKGELHLPSFVVNKLMIQSKKYRESELKNAFQHLLDAEIKLKTGYFDPVLLLEQLVVRITK